MRLSPLTLCLTALLLLPAIQRAHAQGRNPLETYAFDIAVPVTECTFEGAKIGSAVQAPPGGIFFYLTPIPNRDESLIKFLRWTDTTSYEFRTFNAPTGDRYFCVNTVYLDRYSSRRYLSGWASGELATGALLLPVKMRFGGDGRSFDFSKDVTFGTTVGWRLRMHNQRELYSSVLGGVGISSVTLDSLNTRGAVRTGTDRAALTWTAGLMLEVDRFQIGVFMGQDRISQPNQAAWVNQGRTWLSLGLGYSILSAPPKEAAKKNDND